VVRPGLVHTRMTEGLRPAPLSATPDAVAAVVVDAVRTRKELVWAPAPLRVPFVLGAGLVAVAVAALALMITAGA
jgi:hypothetical protein